MARRPDPEVVEVLLDVLGDGREHPLTDIERACKDCANRHDLLLAGIALRVQMRGAASRRFWQLPAEGER